MILRRSVPEKGLDLYHIVRCNVIIITDAIRQQVETIENNLPRVISGLMVEISNTQS